MIKKDKSPVQWAAFMYELEDAKEHLERLILDLESDPDFDEINLRIDLGHVYSHLNRAWFQRNTELDCSKPEEFEKASQFPIDLDPYNLAS